MMLSEASSLFCILVHTILTNEEDMVSDLEYLPGLGKSDHVSLTYNCFIEAAFNNFKQVAQRATIAHLRTSKYFQIVL